MSSRLARGLTYLCLGTGTIGLVHVLQERVKPKQTEPESEYVFFRPLSTNERIQDSLKTGDLVLFQRGLPDTFGLRGLFSFLSRSVTDSPWDHVGVIVRSPDPKNDIPFVLESSFSSTQLYPFDERMIKSNSKVIALRRISVLSDPEPTAVHQARDTQAFELAQKLVQTHPATSFPRLVWANLLPKSLARKSLLKDVCRVQHLQNEIDKFQKELSSLPAAPSSESRRTTLRHLIDRRQQDLAALQSFLDSQKSNSASKSFFSKSLPDAELVAHFYQRLGFLPSFPPSQDYSSPDFFSSSSLPVLSHVKLSEEVYVKGVSSYM
eukprot:TRINITY_DN3212_c0_g1_i3.p1 TRINITY_DN3212_c0_g1~~TRINITY_DN3212_c0_g1_i3.p1  ORF type:complete len:322 (-),score=25.12 TRINITY_DN3212_c0_g1_i3:33-998(-)